MWRHSLGSLLMAVMAFATTAHADDDAGAHRVIAGHRFVPSLLVPWGFVETEVSTTSSFGIWKMGLDSVSLRALVSEPRDGRFIAIAQSFAGAVAVTPWLGLSARLTGSGIIPRDAFTAFVVGAQAGYGGEAGLTISLVHTPGLQIAVRGDAGYNFNRGTVPARLPDPAYVEGNIRTLRPSLIIALPLSPSVGLRAAGSVEWRRFDVEQNDTIRTLQGGLAATVAMWPTSITLLLGGGARHQYSLDLDTVTSRALLGTDATRFQGEGGLYYTGRYDLELGAVFVFESDSDGVDRVMQGHLRFGYYF
jgi:hypothetical protein